MTTPDHSIGRLCDLLKQSRKTVVLTGAGVSTLSGIPDFRSANGLYAHDWHGMRIEDILSLPVFRAHPEYFRVTFDVTVAGQTYAAIGNRFLLSYPEKQQVQCSRSLTDEQIAATVEQMLAKARRGVVLVSPAISKGEQAVMRAVLDARLPLIFLTPWGFNAFSKPGHQYYNACAEGRFLILAPWPHENQRIPLTRSMCLALNAMTAAICQQ